MKAIDNNDIDVDDFYENAPILESLRDGLLLAKQVARVEVGLVLAHLRISRMSNEDEENDKYHVVRAPQSTDHKCWVSGNEADIKRAKSEICATWC